MPSGNQGNIQMFCRKPARVNLQVFQKKWGSPGKAPLKIVSGRKLKPNLGSAEEGLESAIEVRSAQGHPPQYLRATFLFGPPIENRTFGVGVGSTLAPLRDPPVFTGPTVFQAPTIG